MHGTRTLVTYASKHGATAEIARALGEGLVSAGVDAEVHSAREVKDLTPYSAVVLGSALYNGRWQKDALAFLKRHAEALSRRPIWLFDSGPLDHSAEATPQPLPTAVQKIISRLDIRGHVTFGGRLGPGTPGIIEHLMVRGGASGDFRDFGQIRAWADTITKELGMPVAVG